MEFTVNGGEDGSFWALIFHHNSTHGYFTKNNVLNHYSTHLFSVLSKIDDSFKVDGNFEFLLKYPELSDYAQWTQTENPIYAQPNTSNGYKPKHYDWNYEFTLSGLSLSSSTHCSLLDGSPFLDSWFFGIGAYGNCLVEGGDGAIPGPGWTFNGKYLHVVNLYIKVFDSKLIRKLYYSSCQLTQKPFIHSIIFDFTFFMIIH